MTRRTTPDAVAAPAAGATLFRASPLLSRARLFGLSLVANLIVQPLVRLMLGADPDPWWGLLLRSAVYSAAIVAALQFLPRSPFNTWVRTSDGGLELCTAGSDPILLAWPDVASAQVRRRRLRTVLEVTPVEMTRVQRAEVHFGLPPVRDGAFLVDAGLLRPDADVLRRTLAAHA